MGCSVHFLHVHFHITFLCEGFATGGTLEGLVSIVQPQMILHVAQLVEDSVAIEALQGHLSEALSLLIKHLGYLEPT